MAIDPRDLVGTNPTKGDPCLLSSVHDAAFGLRTNPLFSVTGAAGWPVYGFRARRCFRVSAGEQQRLRVAAVAGEQRENGQGQLNDVVPVYDDVTVSLRFHTREKDRSEVGLAAIPRSSKKSFERRSSDPPAKGGLCVCQRT